MRAFMFLILFSTFLVACSQDPEKLKEKSNIEGEAQAKGQQRAEGDRATKMEKDLATRQNFYQALSGIYEGNLIGDDANGNAINLNVRFTFVPSLPPYKSDRIRTIDEVTNDLNNLFLTVQVVQWDPIDKDSIVFGCTYQHVRPDLTRGEINLAAGDCQSLFKINIFETDPTKSAPSQKDIEEISSKISKEILSGERTSIPELVGYRQSVKTISTLVLKVKRK